MSVERELLIHWKACVESRDRVCISAFADRLMELWEAAVREDAEFYLETGTVAPVLRLIHNGVQLNADHSAVEGRVEILMRISKRKSKVNQSLTCGPPSSWDYNQVNQFVRWVEFHLPATLPERSSTGG